MKELSIEQKAKRYDEAIEIARQYYNDRAMPIGTNFKLERMFPELKESEDEKIRKELISFVRGMLACHDKPNAERDEKYESWIAWLEKQAEQKHTPKHKIGDTIYYNSFGEVKSMVVSDVAIDGTDNPMYEDKDGNAVFEKDLIEHNLADKVEHKFKVGDEIKTANEESLTITKIDEKGYWSEDLFICDFDEECLWDLVEQKPIDKTKSKFKQGDWIIFNGLTLQVKGVVKGFYITTSKDGITNGYDWSIDNAARLWTIQDAKDGDVLVLNNEVFIYAHRKQMYSIAVAHCFVDSAGSFYLDGEFGYKEYGKTISQATKEQRDTLLKAMADAGYTFDFDKKELKNIEQKSADWSADDLPEFESYLCLMFQKFRTKGVCTNGEIVDFVKEHSQKLKDTLCHVWSEEDEKQARQIERIVHNDGCTQKLQEQIANWFSSLKDRYTLKPSDEQMETLKYACGGNYVDLGVLDSLYNDLKKLKGE